MTCDEQLEEWLKGKSIHNTGRDECCPDFSCCEPKLLAPEHERASFVAADGTTREQMLMMFLGRGMSELGKDIYIAGDLHAEGVPEDNQ